MLNLIKTSGFTRKYNLYFVAKMSIVVALGIGIWVTWTYFEEHDQKRYELKQMRSTFSDFQINFRECTDTIYGNTIA